MEPKHLYYASCLLAIGAAVYSMWRTRQLVKKSQQLRRTFDDIVGRYDQLIFDLTVDNMNLRRKLGLPLFIGVQHFEPAEPLTPEKKETIH